MAMDFDRLRAQKQEQNQDTLARSRDGDYVRDPLDPTQPPAAALAAVPPLHVKTPPGTATDTSALHVEPPASTRRRPARTRIDAPDIIAVVTSRRDPTTAPATESLHFQVDETTGRRLREAQKRLRLEHRADLNLSLLIESSLDAALADPAGWREAALTLPPVPGPPRAVRVLISADTRQRVADLAEEHAGDDTRIPLARLARVALAMALDRLEHGLRSTP